MKKVVLALASFCAISLSVSCNSASNSTFSVNFDTDGGTPIESIEVKKGSTISKPNDPIKEENYQYTFEFIEWQLNGKTYNFDTPVNDNITLKASYEATPKKYKASATNTAFLQFTTMGGESIDNIPISTDRDFTFKMNLIDSNGEEAKLPNELDIRVGDETAPKLNSDCYEIDTSANSAQEAKVTIHGDKISGDVHITGFAYKPGFYLVTTYLKGVTSTATDYYPCGITPHDGILFTSYEYKAPTADNFWVCFNGTKWVQPTEHPVEGEENCTIEKKNDEESVLYINTIATTQNVDIFVRGHDYPLLNQLSWRAINDISNSGVAPYVFEIGEEKLVNYNGHLHRARIIGFNHDQIAGAETGAKAGITFEMINTLTEKDNKPELLSFDEKDNKDYINSFLNRKLNTKFFTPDSYFACDSELPTVVKKVKKKVGVFDKNKHAYTATEFETYCFPLAFEEMCDLSKKPVFPDFVTRGEGTTYAYYKGSDPIKDGIRIKKELVDTEIDLLNYWLRSPYVVLNYAGVIDDFSSANCMNMNDGLISLNNVNVKAHRDSSRTGIAPAFCI